MRVHIWANVCTADSAWPVDYLHSFSAGWGTFARIKQTMTEYEDLIGVPVAKIPDHHDMDWGQFKQHWLKRHAHLDPTWDKVAEKYDDDDAPIWWAVRNDHERIHAGRGRAAWDPPFSGIPVDHVHLPRVDPEIQRQLEDLL